MAGVLLHVLFNTIQFHMEGSEAQKTEGLFFRRHALTSCTAHETQAARATSSPRTPYVCKKEDANYFDAAGQSFGLGATTTEKPKPLLFPWQAVTNTGRPNARRSQLKIRLQ